ncbi:MAG: hypothetical protein ACM3S1_01145 [Hyphomicrobiales bacterium]
MVLRRLFRSSRAEVHPRLRRRDTSPLSRSAVLRFQAIALGKDPSASYRWALDDDGAWYLNRRSGSGGSLDRPFDTDMPKEPTRRLSAEVVAEVREQLARANFQDQDQYQSEDMKDGTAYVVTARTDGTTHEVVYLGVENELVEYLSRFAARHGEDGA